MVTLRRKLLPPEGKTYFFDIFVPDFLPLSHTIDFVTISSIPLFHIQPISDILKANGFKLVSNPELKDGKFERKLEFKDGERTIDILYGMRLPAFIKPTIIIRIHDPNFNILERFQKIFADLMIQHKLLEIELTFDFYTDNVGGLEHFINSHLFLRYQNQRLPSMSLYLMKGNILYYRAKSSEKPNLHKTSQWGNNCQVRINI